MTGTAENWPALSFLEGLRPGPDETVELALLASYSADLGVIGATLLALAGKDTESGGGSPADFADSVERLRGKVRIVIQRGRLAKSVRTPRIAAVLDQFVREVDFDEATHSWHPKAVLIKTRNGQSEVGWRLWIGSRNLTECVNRDIGLQLVSTTRGGSQIEGVNELARGLADKAALRGVRASSLAVELARVKWRAPSGVRVERIHWLDGTGGHAVPTPSVGTDEVVVVSPFVDRGFVASQMRGNTTSTRSVLLTTLREVERIGPGLAAFDELLAMDAPDYAVGDLDVASGPDDIVDKNEEEYVGQGLHAKLLFMRSGQKRRLWLGSANATMRAWTGRNAEVVAELVINEAVEKGLKALLNSARLVAVPDAELPPDSAELEEQALERARAQVAARWAAKLTVHELGQQLIHGSDLHSVGPHPDEADIALEVGAINGDLVAWPRSQRVVELGQVAPAERSEFVRLRVSREGKSVSWLQRAPAEPALGPDRDRAAFVRLLGGRAFLLWLGGLLADDGRQADGDWTNDGLPGGDGADGASENDLELPTLEDMLAAWSRNSDKFKEIERKVSQYLPAVIEQAEQEEPHIASMLKDFTDLWRTLRCGLGLSYVKEKNR